jgi:UDP-N-acetylmuramate--alanine ligase
VTFGKTKTSDFYISNVMYKNGYQNFDINDHQRNKKYSFCIQQPGIHNVFNAAASIAVAIEEGIPISSIKRGIKEFTGVGRRYEKHEINLNFHKKILIDDYGHHPIEILSNIKACREEFPNKKICMIFQPHRFSRTAQLFDNFVKVLKTVDSLILLDIYAASEKPIKGIDSRTLVESIKQLGHKDTIHIKKHSDVLKMIDTKKNSFDILITQGAGSVSAVTELIKNKWKN